MTDPAAGQVTLQTLLYLIDDDVDDVGGPLVLLGRKLRGFGRGKVMAPGGHVEPGESVVAAAVRELEEETRLRVAETNAAPMAVLTYRFPARPVLDAEVHAFVARRWHGTLAGSDELEPRWFPLSSLPLGDMWDDERYWLPRMLAGERLAAELTYDDACEKVVRFDVTRVLDD